MWNGKIIGVLLGLIFGGPFGLVIGLMLGHLYDIGTFDRLLGQIGWRRRAYYQSEQTQHIFFQTTFTMMGYIAKSDGRVSEKEIQYARSVMQRMELDDKMSAEAIRLFNVGKQSEFNAHQAVEELKRACWARPGLLRNFLEIQMQCAMVDGTMTSNKRNALESLYRQFGLSGFSFDQFERQSRAQQNYQRHYQQRGQQGGPWQHNTQQHINDAYNILGVNKSTSDSDVKKAYRRAMSKHHPDKLMSQGMPPEMIKMATEKTQQIKKAYDTIKQARGIS